MVRLFEFPAWLLGDDAIMLRPRREVGGCKQQYGIQGSHVDTTRGGHLFGAFRHSEPLFWWPAAR